MFMMYVLLESINLMLLKFSFWVDIVCLEGYLVIADWIGMSNRLNVCATGKHMRLGHQSNYNKYGKWIR